MKEQVVRTRGETVRVGFLFFFFKALVENKISDKINMEMAVGIGGALCSCFLN